MIMYDDIILIRYAEGILEEKDTQKIDFARKTDTELNLRIDKFEKTINLLKKFGEILNEKKKTEKNTELSSNIVQIAEYLKNKKIA